MKLDRIRELSQNILDGKEHLSFSSFNAFLKSPAHFIEYKFGKKKKTDYFDVGNLIHTLLLEPKEFNTRYEIFDRKEVLPFPDKNYQTKANRVARDDFFASLPANVKAIEKADFEEAQTIVESIKKVKAAKGILEMCDTYEKELNFEYGGFNWKGFTDASCVELTVDLKTTKDASSNGFKRAIRQYGYHRQAFLYNMADNNKDKPYFIIAVEKEKPFGVSVNHITPQLIDKAKRQIDKGLIDFRRCLIDETLFLQTYEFWAKKSHGVFEVDLTYY